MKNYSKAYKDYELYSGLDYIEYSHLVDWAFQYGITAIIYKDEDGFTQEISDQESEYFSDGYDDLLMCLASLANFLFEVIEEKLSGTDVFEEVFALKRSVQKIPANKQDRENLISGLFNAASKSWTEVNSSRGNFPEYREKCLDLCMFLLSTIYLHERADQKEN